MKRDADAYLCEECGAVTNADDGNDAPPLYECGDCGTRYDRDSSADGASHRCPDCGKFGAKVADHACPECSEGELVPLYREG